MEDDLTKKKWKTSKKMEDDLKKMKDNHKYNLKKATLIGCDILVN